MAEYAIPLAYAAAGLVLLVVAGDRLVRHAAALAVAHHVPKTVVGAVVLGFGTSLPELGVSLDAALRGSSGIAIGNVVGSNIANVGLILGIGAVLVTLHVERRALRADLPFGVLAALFLLVWVGPAGEISRLAGAILLVAFALYLWNSLRHTRNYRDSRDPDLPAPDRSNAAVDIAWIVGGLVGIIAGADLLVRGAVDVAEMFGVPHRVIAVSMVAVGTSLPELTAIIHSARHGEADLAVGNVAGSNLFNILFVLGTTAAIKPVPVEPEMISHDFPVVAAFSVLAFPLLVKERRIGRRQGFLLLAAYAGYIGWVWSAQL
jgi:cation:H+ antiporter